jgi:hypothetical protein
MKAKIIILFLLGFLGNIYGQSEAEKQLINKIENAACEKRNKSIDAKVLKIEKKINKKLLEQGSYLYDSEIMFINIIKNKQELKKIDFEIIEKENYDEYNKKTEIYFENNKPILIKESIKQKSSFLVDGLNKKTGKYDTAKIFSQDTISVKIYSYDWDKYDVMIIGKNYDKEFKKEYHEYDKIIKTILAQLK